MHRSIRHLLVRGSDIRARASRIQEPDPLWVAVFATALGVGLLGIWRFQHQLGPFFVGLYAKEGPFELVTFLLEAIAAVWCARAAWLLPRPLTWTGRAERVLYAALAAVLFLVAMEEINWGQTFIGFHTPEAWSAINYQHETSLHNLLDKTELTDASKVVSVLFTLGALALVAIRMRYPESLPGRIAPPPTLVPLALCVAYAGVRQHAEMGELVMSVFFAFYSYRVWKMAKGASTALSPPEPDVSDRPSRVARGLRTAIGVGLIVLLVSRFDGSQLGAIGAQLSLPLLLGAAVAMALILLISAWKWNWALLMHDLRHPFPFVLKTLSIGFFFNHFLPTAVGGDMYRVLQTMPREGFRSRALSAVVVERIVGLAALLALGAVGALRLVETQGVMHEYLYALAVAAALLSVGVLAVKSGWMHGPIGRWRRVPAVKAILHNLSLLRKHPREWSGLILGSFAFQLVSIGIIFVLFSALSVNVTPSRCALIAALVGVASALPVSINGIGVMEGTFVATAMALGIDYEPAVAAAFLRRGLAIALAIPCGGLWLSQAHRQNPAGSPRELARYVSAWKRDGMRGLLDELQPVAPGVSLTERLEHPIPDVPLAVPCAGEDLSHAALLEYTHDAIIIWEMHGRGILYWNQAAERLYGYARERALGKTTHLLLRTEVTGGVRVLESALARYGVWLGELRHTASDGRTVDVEGRLSILSQENGRWLVLEVNRDITDRKAAEAERARMEAQLTQLRAMIGSGD